MFYDSIYKYDFERGLFLENTLNGYSRLLLGLHYRLHLVLYLK